MLPLNMLLASLATQIWPTRKYFFCLVSFLNWTLRSILIRMAFEAFKNIFVYNYATFEYGPLFLGVTRYILVCIGIKGQIKIIVVLPPLIYLASQFLALFHTLYGVGIYTVGRPVVVFMLCIYHDPLYLIIYTQHV